MKFVLFSNFAFESQAFCALIKSKKSGLQQNQMRSFAGLLRLFLAA